MNNILLSRLNLKIIFSFLFFSMVLSVTAQTPSGFNLVAYEGFDYTSGTDIANQSGGSGWAGNWEANFYGNSSMFVYSPGLSYSGLNVSGNKLEWGGSGTYEPHSVRRAINNQKSGVVYLQFIADFNSSGGGTDRVDLNSGGTTQASFGGNNAAQKMSILAGGQTINSTYSVYALSLVIIQIDYNNNTTKMWVNPTYSTFNYSNPGTPDALYNNSIAFDEVSLTFREGGQIDEISIFALPTSAPTSISGTTSICNGSSTTLTSSGGNISSEGVNDWYEGTCGVQAFHEGWNTQPTSTLQTSINSNLNGILNLTSTGVDPQINMFNLGSFDPTVYKYINFRYRIVSGLAGEAQFFFLNVGETMPDGSKYINKTLISDNQWHTISVDMSTNALWTTGGSITGIRYDYATNTGVTLNLDFIELSTAPLVGTGASITVTPSATTTYYANRKGYNVNTTCVSQAVTVNALPIPTFTAQPIDLVIDSDVSYTAESGQTNYVWTFPGIQNIDYSITSGGTFSDNTVVLKWLKKGSKAVQVNYINSNGCSGAAANSSTSVIVRNSGIGINGNKITNPLYSLDSNGKIGSGKSISIYGEPMDTPVPPKIGDTYQGGIVFYTTIDGSGVTHGLIAATADQADAYWNDRLTRANSYTGGGYNDWRLPNTTELGYLFAKRNISGLSGTFDTSMASVYWPSNNFRSGTDSYATGFSFDSGGINIASKSYQNSIRAIRSF